MPDSFIQRITKISHGQRVYIIPTSIGFYFSFVTFVLFLIAISYGHNLAFFCTFLFFAFVSFSAVITNESIKSINIYPSEETILVENSFSPLKIVIENISRRSQFDLNIEIQGLVVGSIEEVGPLEKKTIYLDMSQLKLLRGVYQFTRLTISTRFPLGLFYSWKYRSANNILKVVPIAIEGKVASEKEAIDSSSDTKFISSHTGIDEFIETRDHRMGEGFARIDQKRSIILGNPQVRSYCEDIGMAKFLDLRGDDVEDSLSKATFYINNHPTNISLTLILPDGFRTISSSGNKHHQYLLELLSEFGKEKVFLN